MKQRCAEPGCITILSRDTIEHGWDKCSHHRAIDSYKEAIGQARAEREAPEAQEHWLSPIRKPTPTPHVCEVTDEPDEPYAPKVNPFDRGGIRGRRLGFSSGSTIDLFRGELPRKPADTRSASEKIEAAEREAAEYERQRVEARERRIEASLQLIDKLAAELGRTPSQREYDDAVTGNPGLYMSRNSLMRIRGVAWSKIVESRGLPPITRIAGNPEKVERSLAFLRELAQRLGRGPSSREYDQARPDDTYVANLLVRRAKKRWSQLVAETGYTPLRPGQTVTERVMGAEAIPTRYVVEALDEAAGGIPLKRFAREAWPGDGWERAYRMWMQWRYRPQFARVDAVRRWLAPVGVDVDALVARAREVSAFEEAA